MKAPIPRNVDDLVARFKEVEAGALDSVARPHFMFTGQFYPPRPDDADWYQKEYAADVVWRARSRAAVDAAAVAAFTSEDLSALILAQRETPTDPVLFRAASTARRALKTLAVQRRHKYLLTKKAEGTLPPRLCAGCHAPLVEDTWDPSIDTETGP